MPEGYSYSPFEDFDSTPLQQALGVESRPMRDVAHGEGEAVTLDGKAELEVYPSAGVARVTTENTRVELFRLPGVSTHESGHVLFELTTDNERTRLSVSRDGTVSLRPVIRASGAPQASEESSPSGETETAQGASGGATEPSQTAEQEHPDRTTTLAGRLGRDPWFQVGEDGEARAGFPFAVNHDQGGTTWHTVFTSTPEAAEQVKAGKEAGYIRKGKLVRITGTLAGDGERSKKNTFYATSVDRPQAPKRPNRQS